jgi:hypothetical protein
LLHCVKIIDIGTGSRLTDVEILLDHIYHQNLHYIFVGLVCLAGTVHLGVYPCGSCNLNVGRVQLVVIGRICLVNTGYNKILAYDAVE